MTAMLGTICAKDRRRIVGLISGTSADGIDALVAEVTGCGKDTRCEILGFETVALESGLRAQIFALFEEEAGLDELCRINFALGEAFAAAALQVIAAAGLEPAAVDLIGSHGQTVRHLPQATPAATLQIGEPAVIAQRTGITTIADFRPADMAVGGQGAPLVPLADYLLCGHAERGRLVLNIGGIANLTVLPAAATVDEVMAFDLGPGNMIVDGAVAHFSGGRERFDRDGRRAAAGAVDDELLSRLLEHQFLHRPPPKSTGREEFGSSFLSALLQQADLAPDDLVATLTAFTARSIIAGISAFVPGAQMEELWVGGGGVHNPVLMEQLGTGLPQLRVASVEGLGIPADGREALAFAVLANETLMGRWGNLPAATGARRSVVLGKIVPGRGAA